MDRIRPTIGVTGPDKNGAAAWFFTRINIWLAGGKAVRLMPSKPRSIEELDGLIIGGGADVDPALYGEQSGAGLDEFVSAAVRRSSTLRGYLKGEGWIFYPMFFLMRKLLSLGSWSGAETSGTTDSARDALEYRLIDEAVRREIPVLGICRGAQLLNVYFGGSLYRDLQEFYVETLKIHSILPEKRIALGSDSRLAKILRTTRCKVNGLHWQAVKHVGKNLRVVAREASGVIQAVEHRTRPFVIGVQWHPEYMIQVERQRRIFRILVQNAKVRRDVVQADHSVQQQTETDVRMVCGRAG